MHLTLDGDYICEARVGRTLLSDAFDFDLDWMRRPQLETLLLRRPCLRRIPNRIS
jgi:hypothetical protein